MVLACGLFLKEEEYATKDGIRSNSSGVSTLLRQHDDQQRLVLGDEARGEHDRLYPHTRDNLSGLRREELFLQSGAISSKGGELSDGQGRDTRVGGNQDEDDTGAGWGSDGVAGNPSGVRLTAEGTRTAPGATASAEAGELRAGVQLSSQLERATSHSGPLLPDTWQAAGGWIEGFATHYGESYEGQPLGCGRVDRGGAVNIRPSAGQGGLAEIPGIGGASQSDGLYHSADPTILAVAWPSRDYIPCGAAVRVCARVDRYGAEQDAPLLNGDTRGSLGVQQVRCITVARQDSCPGCHPNTLDLSESGLEMICPGSGSCPVWWKVSR